MSRSNKHSDEVLNSVLSEFVGKTPDQIMAVVQKWKIKGRMGTTYGCPLALLMSKMGGGAFVIGRRYVVRRTPAWIVKARTPQNLATFVRKFDIGGYPDLVSPPPRCLAPRSKQAPHPSMGEGRTRPAIKNHLAKLVGRFHEAAA